LSENVSLSASYFACTNMPKIWHVKVETLS